MEIRTPMTLITGPLGSGKTTLLRHLLDTVSRKMAILVNEFGEIGIDSKVIEGKNIRIAELDGGCVCCSLQGEFEAAVHEVIEKVEPELVVVETTGVAEPDGIVFDIKENLPQLRLDGVITVADADAMVRFPQIGHTTRLQLEEADIVLLNKIDLIRDSGCESLRQTIQHINHRAPIFATSHCRVDADVLFGLFRQDREVRMSEHLHQSQLESVIYRTPKVLDKNCFQRFADGLDELVYRAKGFVHFEDGAYLFNFVAGRWEIEPFGGDETRLIFIGEHLESQGLKIMHEIKKCEPW